MPSIRFDPALPINARQDEIRAAIERYPIVIVCGETGSGKTTQLPKMLLDMGRGRERRIGHTQPRRIAARATAARIAEELDREVDRIVMRMLRKAPEARYANWAELAIDLAEIGRFSVYVKDIPDREKFIALRGFKPLEKLNDAEIWELVHASYWVRVPAQTTIMKEGDKGAKLMFLASSEVKVVKLGRLLNVLRTGSYFGEMTHVKGSEMGRTATVETMTDALSAEFRPAAMKKLSVNCQLQLSQSLLNAVIDRLAFADERIARA